MEGCGVLWDCRYLLHDRDTKFTRSFRAIIASGGVEPLALPACSLNLNAYAERWVRSVKEECLSKVILFGERSLRRAERLCRAFPRRAESPGEGQCSAVSSGYRPPPRGSSEVPRATGRASALLSSSGGVMARRPFQLFGLTGSDRAAAFRRSASSASPSPSSSCCSSWPISRGGFDLRHPCYSCYTCYSWGGRALSPPVKRVAHSGIPVLRDWQSSPATRL
jgi:hypothetical protein